MFGYDSMICNYSDDTTIYVWDYDSEEIIRKLENYTVNLSNWFPDNNMKVNGEKCHLMYFSNVQSNSIAIQIKK